MPLTFPLCPVHPQTVYNTSCPVWEAAFRFFLQDPRSQELDVQVNATLLPLTSRVWFICLSYLKGGEKEERQRGLLLLV